MKFPRNARMLKGHLDFAPFASVFFCLLIFVLLTRLVYTPGVVIHLAPPSPGATSVPGPTVSVELDAPGRLYFENHPISDADLKFQLQQFVRQYFPAPVTLAVLADTNSLSGRKMQVFELGRQAGITNFLDARAAGVFDPRGK